MGQNLISNDDVVIAANEPIAAGGAVDDSSGDIVLRTGGVERARIDKSGLGSGLLGGSLTANGTNDIVFTAGGVERGRIAHDGTITGLAAAANVATLSELTATIMVQTGISVTTSLGLWVAPFAARVTSLSITWSEAHAQSDTDYWTAQLKKEPSDVIIASKTTQLTGGFPVVQWTDWNFDAVTFDATNKVLAKGDSLRLRLAPTGAPAALTGTLATLRYEPI